MSNHIRIEMDTTKILIMLILSETLMHEHVVSAIKCYVCQSNVDPKCADPFDNLTLPITDCSAYPRADLATKSDSDSIDEGGFFSLLGGQAPVKPLRASLCRKIRQKVNGEWRTIRGCGYLGNPGNQPEGSSCQMRHGTHDIFMETCTCNNKDGCNGSLGAKEFASVKLFLLIVVISLTALICQFKTAYLPPELTRP